ncbi:MAG: helix-turn-helix domain-containing protein [Rhodothermales bacterium]|nr:helix-turn-helix domain-containing protein [Rhodothermales bacterium]
MTKTSHIDMEPDEDLIYRALASATRRRILDVVRESDGITLGEIAERFDISRFAVRKHIKILMDAHLLTVTADGTAKRHFLNPVPIQSIQDRWLSQYSRRWAAALNGLKYTLEGTPMNQLQHRYEVFIRASAEAVWQAITDPDFTQQFYYGTRVESDFQAGSDIVYRYADGTERTAITGEILEIEAPHRLVHSFDFGNGDAASRVVYELQDLGGVCKLTLTHDGFESETKTFQSVQSGWNPILSGLKTLLETGNALKIPSPAEAH